MRATGERRCGHLEWDHAPDFAGDQVEFGNARGVPEGDEGATAVMGDNRRVGEGARNALEGRKVEAVEDSAVGGAKEDGFVGALAGDEDVVGAARARDAQARRVGDIVEHEAALFAGRNAFPRNQRDEAFRRDDAIFEAVNGNAVPGASLPLAKGIGERGDRGVQVLAVGAEGQTEKIGLLGAAAEAFVGKVAEFVGGQIENGEGLLLAGRVGAEAAVEKDREAPIGRDDRSGGKIVDGARVPGDFGEKFAVGEFARRLGKRLGCGRRGDRERTR